MFSHATLTFVHSSSDSFPFQTTNQPLPITHNTSTAAHERLASSLSTDAANTSTSTTPATPAVQLPTIGRPGYRVTKGEDEDGAKTLTFEIEYPEIAPNTKPLFRYA